MTESNVQLFAVNPNSKLDVQSESQLASFAGRWKFDVPKHPGDEDHDLLVDVDDAEVDPVTAMMNHVLRVASGERFGGTGWMQYDPTRKEHLSYSISHGGRLDVHRVVVKDNHLEFTGPTARAILHLDADGNALHLIGEFKSSEKWILKRRWAATRH